MKISINELIAMKRKWGVLIATIMKLACSLELATLGRYKTCFIVANKNRWNQNKLGAWFVDERSSRFEPLLLRPW